MVDEAHATGAVGPGGRGSVAAAGLSGEVDVVVGTLGKALGSYGAYVCADAETIDFLRQHGPPLHLLHRPAAAGHRRGLAALAILEAEPELVERLQANAATLRGALAAEGLSVGRSATQIVPIEVGEAETTMELCERALRARRLRPGDPAADRARGILAPALHGDGDPPTARSWSEPRARSAPPRASSGSSPPGPWPPEAVADGVFVTGTGTEVGKTVVAAAIARTLAAEGKRVAVFKPAVTGLDEGVETDHAPAAPRLRLGAERRGDRPLPLRPARLAPPRRGAGRRGDRPRAPARRRPEAAAEGADAIVCEGVGGLSSRSPPPTSSATSPPTSAIPLVVVASPGPGDDQPHPADARGGPRRRARGRGRRPHSLARGADRDRALQPRDDRHPRRVRPDPPPSTSPTSTWPPIADRAGPAFAASRSADDHVEAAVGELDARSRPARRSRRRPRGRSAPSSRISSARATSPRTAFAMCETALRSPSTSREGAHRQQRRPLRLPGRSVGAGAHVDDQVALARRAAPRPAPAANRRRRPIPFSRVFGGKL